MFSASKVKLWGFKHYLLMAVAILIPTLFSLYLAYTSGTLSVRDYWAIIGRVYSADGFSTSIGNWFTRQNDHIVFIPRLIYVLNILINHGSNTGLSLTAWGLALIQTILLTLLIPANIKDFRVLLFMILAISGFSFAPTATDNWMHGFSGVHWMLANVFAIAAIGCFVQFMKNNGKRWLAATFGLAGLGIITYGTSIAVWPALLFAFLVMRTRWRLGLTLTAITIVILAVAFINRPQVALGSLRSLDKIIGFGPYIAIFLGGPFTTNIPLAFAIGTVSLVVSIGLLINFGIVAKASERLEMLPWLLIMVFALLNGAILAYGRLQLGIESATTQRYITISGLFWISLLIMLGYWCYQAKERIPMTALAPYAGLVIALNLAMVPLGIDRANRWYHKMSLQPAALLSIDLDIPDERAIEVAIVRGSRAFTRLVPAMKRDNLSPYHNNAQSFDGFSPCGQVGTKLNPGNIGIEPAKGAFEFIDPLDDQGGIRAIGWLENQSLVQNCLVLANNAGEIKGLGLTGFDRVDLDTPQKSGWIGYARLDSPEEQIGAFIQPVGSDTWQALTPTRSAQNPGQIRLEAYTSMASSTLDEYSGLDTFNNFLATFGYIPASQP